VVVDVGMVMTRRGWLMAPMITEWMRSAAGSSAQEPADLFLDNAGGGPGGSPGENREHPCGGGFRTAAPWRARQAGRDGQSGEGGSAAARVVQVVQEVDYRLADRLGRQNAGECFNFCRLPGSFCVTRRLGENRDPGRGEFRQILQPRLRKPGCLENGPYCEDQEVHEQLLRNLPGG
jgi:hypothetical protein